MFHRTVARRCVLGLPILAVFANPIWRQILARAEFAKFHRAALEEIVWKQNLDPQAFERVRRSL